MKMYNSCGAKRYAALDSPNYNNFFSSLFPMTEMTFEGIRVNVPNDYENHLVRRYGDYRALPPVTKRVGHTPYIIDLGK
jgi:lipopolysaccharide cholinephosphotransferase